MKKEVILEMAKEFSKGLSREQADEVAKMFMKEGGVRFLTDLGKAKSVITSMIDIFEIIPGVTAVNIQALIDSSRFLDAVVEKFMEAIVEE